MVQIYTVLYVLYTYEVIVMRKYFTQKLCFYFWGEGIPLESNSSERVKSLSPSVAPAMTNNL